MFDEEVTRAAAVRRGTIVWLLVVPASLAIAFHSGAQVVGNRTEAASCASAIGGNVTGTTISVVCGIPAENLEKLVRGRTEPLEELVNANRETIALLKQNLNLNEQQIRAALDAAGEVNVPPEHLADKLVEIAQRYTAMRSAAAPQADDSAKIATLRAETKTAIDHGEMAQADRLLADRERLEDEEIERLVLAKAETTAQRGEVALIQLHYGEAATHFAAAARKVPAERQDVRLRYLEREARSLVQQGYEFGDNAAAASAIDRYRRLLTFYSRERAPLEWAATKNHLGNALRSLGERERNRARLDEAVAAFRDALKERTRERVPLEWAETQNELGNVLLRIGEREHDPASFEQAAAAYREALKERTRERAPLAWAMTENNLGAVLNALAENDRDTARLEQAVSAYREALKERTRDRAPLAWARTQYNLGNALTTLGQRESSTAHLEEAVAAFREALTVSTRQRVPVAWARAQDGLGKALAALGERESGTGLLEEAVLAYQEALKERTRERAPLGWAGTQKHLGDTLKALGERENSAPRLDDAVVAYREALTERTRERVPFDWAQTECNLADALRMSARAASDPDRLQEALATVDAALEVLRSASGDPALARAEQVRVRILAAVKPE